MRFRSYPKIPTHRAEPPRSVGGPWVALEKVHGAQLVIAVGGDEIRFGKRKEWLTPETPFFGWQLIADELSAKVSSLARCLGAPRVFVYGELFGGAYPHPDVPPAPGLQPVQTGVWYAPDLHWSPFDVLIARDDDDEGELLAHAELETLARGAGLVPPPLVRRSRRTDLEQLPVRAPTRVPAELGLPPLEDNVAEGLVLKPDARCRPSERPVIKRKIPEFDDARFDESARWDPGRLSPEELSSWVERLVNPARLASARSKVGEDSVAVLDEIVLDVSVDIELAFHEAWEALGGEGQERLLDEARVAAERLIGRTDAPRG